MTPPIPLVVFAALHLFGTFYTAGYLVHFTHNDVSTPMPREAADVGLIRMGEGRGVLGVERALKAAIEQDDGCVMLYPSWSSIPEVLATAIIAHASSVLVNYVLDVADPRPTPPGVDKRRMDVSQWELVQSALRTVRTAGVAGRSADDVATAPLSGDKFDAFDYTFTCVREPWVDRRDWPKRWMPLTVADLIERLQRVDPELPVVLISDADMVSRPTRKHLVAGVCITLVEGEKEFEVLAITPADGVLYECFGRKT